MKLLKYFTLIGLLISFMGLFSVSFAADPPLPTPVGRVIWIKGTFKAVMPNKEERVLQKMSVVYLNDTLMTDAGSQAQIAFTDNSLMTFRGNTSFYIDQYVYQPKGKAKTFKYIMNLIQGGFRTITGLIAKQSADNYQINTPVATIGVRGTDYTVYYDRVNSEMYIGYYAGVPCVQNKKGTLCLNDKNRYGFASSLENAPSSLAEQPGVLREKLDIVMVTIDPFSGYSGASQPLPTRRSGPITNFCITQ